MKKKVLIAIIIGMCSICTILSQTHIWTGNGGNTDWFNAANWSANSVPTNTSEVLINSGFEANIAGGNAFAQTIVLTGNGMLVVNSSLTISDQLTIDPTGIMLFTAGTVSGGAIVNNGSFVMNTLTLKTLDNLSITNSSQILVTDANQIELMDVVIDNEAGAIIDIASVGGFLSQGNPSVLNNAGRLKKTPDGVNPIGNFYLILDINNSGVISIPEDEVFLCLGGNIDLNNMETGIIEGKGTFDITANFSNTGIISPAVEGTTGTFHVTNNFNISNPGILSIDIVSVSDYDRIEVVGSPMMQGDIIVQCFEELEIGDEFTILTSTNPINQCNFPQFVYADFLASSYEFEVICNPTSVVLRLNDEIILGTNDNNNTDQILKVFPNPVTDELIIHISDDVIGSSDNISARIFTLLGTEVSVRLINHPIEAIDVSGFASGLYLIDLISDERVIGKLKFLKN